MQSEFNNLTNTFFKGIEELESNNDLSKPAAAAALRENIQTYQKSCTDQLSKYDDQMQLRVDGVDKAKKSLVVESNSVKYLADKKKKDETKKDEKELTQTGATVYDDSDKDPKKNENNSKEGETNKSAVESKSEATKTKDEDKKTD